MSLIVTARIIGQGCRFHMLTKNSSYFSHNVLVNTNKFKIFATTSAVTRLYSSKNNDELAKRGFEHIYHGPLATKIKYIKYFSLSTSLCALLMQPYIYISCMGTANMSATIVVGLSFGIFAFLTPYLLHIMTSRYANDIYYSAAKKLYIATTYTIFVKQRQIEFTPADVTQPGMSTMLATCNVKGIPLLIDFNNFNDPDHYSIIMGYDKPMDFSLATQQSAVIDDKKSKNV